MRVEKKIWPEFFEKDSKAKRLVEARLADFELSQGDTIVFREWDPDAQEYTGREFEKKVALVNKVDLKRFYTSEDLEQYGVYAILLED